MDKSSKYLLWFLAIATVVVYFLNLGINDIWNPNEGYYADSVQGMLRSGNILDFYYNHEHRFNKPPVTYWVMGISALIFGLNEFALRLPMVLMAFGTIWLTFLMGRLIYGKKEGIWSAIAMALSLQFMINSRYATPEVPLTFFFTLTLYWFAKGYKHNNFRYLFLSYVALGLTILTKGYPYLIVIGGIIIVYLFIDAEYNFRRFLTKLKDLRLHIGLPLTLAIGFSWVVYSYIKFGEAFLNVLDMETMERAFGYETNWLSELFFFPGVIGWGFLPYSVIFYVAIIYYFRKKETIKEFALPISWVLVMLVIFTIAKFKLPTYFIQAHPAMSLIAGAFIVRVLPRGKWMKFFWNFSLILPGFFISALSTVIIFFFNLHAAFYLLVLLPVILLLYRPGFNEESKILSGYYRYLRFFPYLSMVILVFIFAAFVLPRIEKYRPYDEIGAIIEKNIPTNNHDVPLLVQSKYIFNMPFYTDVKQIGYLDNNIMSDKSYFALVKEEDYEKYPGTEKLWEGYLYRRNSEAVFFIFLEYVIKAENGDFSGFNRYVLIFREKSGSNK